MEHRKESALDIAKKYVGKDVSSIIDDYMQDNKEVLKCHFRILLDYVMINYRIDGPLNGLTDPTIPDWKELNNRYVQGIEVFDKDNNPCDTGKHSFSYCYGYNGWECGSCHKSNNKYWPRVSKECFERGSHSNYQLQVKDVTNKYRDT